jgi:hypothetical protein
VFLFHFVFCGLRVVPGGIARRVFVCLGEKTTSQRVAGTCGEAIRPEARFTYGG